MVEVKGVEICDARGDNINQQCEYVIDKGDGVDIKPGDEVLIAIGKPGGQEPEYEVPLRILDKKEADENEILVQFGDRVLVGQKIPEFI